jgi:hypothetical protein
MMSRTPQATCMPTPSSEAPHDILMSGSPTPANTDTIPSNIFSEAATPTEELSLARQQSLLAELNHVTSSEADVRDFKSRALPFLPIIHIPEEMPAADLSSRRPFLFSCITALCTKSTSQQRDLYTQARAHVAKKLVVDLSRSLDLLFGVMVNIAWSNLENTSGVTVMTQLGMSLVMTLGLNKPPRPTKETDAHLCFRDADVTWHRTMEERRAVLGMWYLASK